VLPCTYQLLPCQCGPDQTKTSYRHHIDAFIRCSARCRFVPLDSPSFETLCRTADEELFKNIIPNNQHVLHSFLPLPLHASQNYSLRPRRYNFELPDRVSHLTLLRECCSLASISIMSLYICITIAFCRLCLKNEYQSITQSIKKPVSAARNLGVYVDDEMSMRSHIISCCCIEFQCKAPDPFYTKIAIPSGALEIRDVFYVIATGCRLPNE